MPASAEQLRTAMRRWACGVSILTTRRDQGILGITVSAFTSVSLDPPLVLACIDRRTRSHALIASQRCFAINVLKAGQVRLSELAAGHAGRDGNLLEGVPHRVGKTGAPILEDVLAWFDCTLVASHDGGDHTIFVGRVEDTGHGTGKPLLYHDGAYHLLGQPKHPLSGHDEGP